MTFNDLAHERLVEFIRCHHDITIRGTPYAVLSVQVHCGSLTEALVFSTGELIIISIDAVYPCKQSYNEHNEVKKEDKSTIFIV
jgi:hypothetical protein